LLLHRHGRQKEERASDVQPDNSMPDIKGRGRQRSTKSESAILTATLRLLRSKPLRDITIEEIAQKAGVGKATIYKWWPSKAYVALDAFLRKMFKSVATPDTGSAQRDLTEQLHSVMAFYTSPTGRIFSQFLAEGRSDPKFAALFRERFLQPRREAVGIILDRGIKRGELNGKLDREIVLDLIYGPMIFRLMAGHGPLNEKEADAMISTLLRGIGTNAIKTVRSSKKRL
jgi:AcrR family transcriptional regulator